MPKFTLAIEGHLLPAIQVHRKCETLSDAAKFLRDAQQAISKAVKVFPTVRDAKLQRITVKAG